MSEPVRVTVWNEYSHERKRPEVREIYPDGIHGAIASHLSSQPGIEARTATLDEPEHGLTEEVLASTDVLVWWAHMCHGEVADEVADRVVARVLGGMGFIALHSAHKSKPLRRLLGTTNRVKWREAGDRQRVWVVEPGHPIAQGLAECFELEHTEMYGERFDIPAPDELVFISWFQGGEVLRSGCCFFRGAGRIFYFQPGHEDYPIYHDENVLRVITNAARWARPGGGGEVTFGNVKALEDLSR